MRNIFEKLDRETQRQIDEWAAATKKAGVDKRFMANMFDTLFGFLGLKWREQFKFAPKDAFIEHRQGPFVLRFEWDLEDVYADADLEESGSTSERIKIPHEAWLRDPKREAKKAVDRLVDLVMKWNLRESEELVEYEIVVRNGVAYNDEGESEPAPGVPDGIYGLREWDRVRPRRYSGGSRRGSYGRRYGSGYGRKPARQPSGVDLERIAALELALKKRRLDFFKSIIDQLRQGRVLSDKQKVAVRRNLHKMKMHDEAKLFEGDNTMPDKTIEQLDEYILDEKRSGFVFPKRESPEDSKKKGSWPIGDKKHAKTAISYMAAGRGKASDYPAIKKAIKAKWGKDKDIMASLKKLGEAEELASSVEEGVDYPTF